MSVPNLTSLLKQSQITDHEEVLRAANATLKTNKNDSDAQHVKLVALLKLDRFDDAVRAVETGAEKLKDTAKLEYAYALYKSGRRREAADIAQSATSQGLQHVEAQALYSLEEFVRAADLYKELGAKAYESEYEAADLRVNSLAVDAQLEWNDFEQHVEDKFMTREDFEAHEALYNQACRSIARGEAGHAEVLLRRARHVCEKLQDLSDDEKAAELLPITVQHIFVLTRLDRQKEALELAKTLEPRSPTTDFTQYLARVNTEAATAASNPFLLERQLSINLDDFNPDRPFRYQQKVLSRNRYALDLAMLKFGGTAASIRSKENQASIAADVTTTSVINAAAHAKNRAGKEGLKHIIPLLEQRPNDVGLILTIIQLYVLTNNPHSAIDLLEKFLTRLEKSGSASVRYAPGLVGTMVSLYSAQGRTEAVRSELSKAAIYWRQRRNDLTPGAVHLLKAAGAALLRSQNGDDAVSAKDLFEILHERDTSDKYAAAGLSAATLAPSTNESALISLGALTEGVNAQKLEDAGIARRDHMVTQIASRKRPASSEPASTKSKKIRRTRMPKDYDPSKKPDPERWLPLRDRSTYKPKGKKGKARQTMLSQGAVTNDSESSRPATPGAEVVKGKAQQSGGAGNKQKKKKAKK